MARPSRGDRHATGVVLTLVAICFFAATAVAQTYDVLNVFNSPPQSYPVGLIQGADGNLYGTTRLGGDNGFGYGTVFKIDTNGSTLTVLHVFGGSDGADPVAGVIQGTDGNLYGTTADGGTYGYGTIFKIDTAGTTLTVLHSFAGGAEGTNPYGKLVQATDGNLYGTTHRGGTGSCPPYYFPGCGTVFKIDTGGSTFTTLHTFTGSDGALPYAGLVQAADGNLYGTTSGGELNDGTIFKIDTAGSTFVTLHTFTGSDGRDPQASLIQATDGKLYGTAYKGGANDYGTIFQIDTTGATFNTLHTFTGPPQDGYFPEGLVQATDGNLYGTTDSGGAGGAGTVFKIDTAGTTYSILHGFSDTDGSYPNALIQATDGNLYGTTAGGGATRAGTIFRIDTSGSTFATIFNFSSSSNDGAYPAGGLIQAADGNLYGVTGGGGASQRGTIFKTDTSGSTLTTLYNFTGGSDGSYPSGTLVQGTDGYLYGTAVEGGSSFQGSIFKIDTNGTTLTTLHSFNINDGQSPSTGVIQGTDGSLYGTTGGGGASGNGTIFKINTDGSGFTTLHDFNYNDGSLPAGLIQGTDGNLYGATFSGGAGGAGTVFKIDTTGASFVTLHAFAGSPGGATPNAALTQAADGNLYGTTSSGGANGDGTIFKTDTAGVTLTTLHSFTGSDGIVPAGVMQGTDGNLYGATYNGGHDNFGTIFKIDTNGTTLTTLHTFTGNDGDYVNPKLLQATDGNFYGTAGGGPGSGVLFRLTLTGAAFQVTSIVPTSGPTDGTVVSVMGSGFEPSDAVSFGGFVASNVSWVSPTQINATTRGLSPGTLNDVVVTNFGSSAQLSKGFFADFLDVPQSDIFHDFIEKIFRNRITAGCGGGNFCPGDSVTRAQMAVFLLEGEHGAGYLPPPCTGIFQDVPCPSGFAVNFIEQLFHEGIAAGCGGGNFCPSDPVTRAQMAVFLLVAQHGSGYSPPACAGIFGDVPCPSGFAVDFIEQLYHEGITGGCSSNPLLYCPDDPNTRGQMAVFLTVTFNLP